MDALSRSLVLGLLALAGAAPSAAQERAVSDPGTIRGTVRGRMADERHTLAHAWITVPDAPGSPSAISGPRGAYALRNVPAGERTVRVSRLGYRDLELQVTVPPGSVLRLDPEVRAAPIAVAGLTVLHQPAIRPIRGASAPTGSTVKVGILELGPGGGEAGLASAARALAGGESGPSGERLLIRGSVADQKRVLLDGVPVHAPFHLGGLLPGLQSELFSEASHHPGAAPVSLPGGLSSVLDLTTRAPTEDRLRGRASVDMAAGALTLEGPLADGVSALASARTLHGLGTRVTSGDPLPYGYRELLLRARARTGERHRLDATFFWNREGVRLDLERAGLTGGSASGPDSERARWHNRATSLRWTGEVVGSTLRASVAGARYEAVLPLGRSAPAWARGRTDRLRASVEGSTPLEGWTLGWGLRGEDLRHRSSARSLSGDSAAVRGAADGRVVGGHLEARRSFAEELSLRAGLRLDHFNRDAASLRLSPRARATWHLSETADLSLGVGRHFQFVQPADLEVQMSLGDPAATRAGQALYPVAGATHAVLSLEQEVSARVFMGADGYVKAFDGLPGISDGELRSSGVDLRVRRRGRELTGWLGYSLAWFWRPGGAATGSAGSDAFTGRHLLSAGLEGGLWSVVGGRVQVAYGDGLPFTSVPILGDATSPAQGEDVQVGDPSDPVDERDPVAPTLDGFLRVDVELDAELETRLGGRDATLRPYLRILNALESRDALFFYFEPWRSPEARPLARRPLLPLLGVEVRF